MAVSADSRGLSVFLLVGHRPLRAEIRRMLEHEGMQLVGEGASAREALARIPAAGPDVAVLDARVADGTGIEVCRQAREALPGLGWVLLGSYHHERPASGAEDCEFVLRDIRAHGLPEAIRRAAAGRGRAPGTGCPG